MFARTSKALLYVIGLTTADVFPPSHEGIDD